MSDQGVFENVVEVAAPSGGCCGGECCKAELACSEPAIRIPLDEMPFSDGNTVIFSPKVYGLRWDDGVFTSTVRDADERDIPKRERFRDMVAGTRVVFSGPGETRPAEEGARD
jgi:hypothetical protein